MGCGSVGRAVASDSRRPQFESNHRRNFIHEFIINCIKKTKIKKKEARNSPFFKKAKNEVLAESEYQSSGDDFFIKQDPCRLPGLR